MIEDEVVTFNLSDEQRQEMMMNQKNILIEMLVPGDGESFPVSSIYTYAYIHAYIHIHT